MSSPSPLGLPLELQEQIIDDLSFPEVVYLKMTCFHINAIIKPLSHKELLIAEGTDVAIEEDVYACCDCLRLRPAWKFGDNMLKKKKRRGCPEARKRFCIDCGTHPGPGTTRYCRGAQIVVSGVLFVICLRCGVFTEGGKDGLENTSECQACWARTKAYRDGLRRREEEHQRCEEEYQRQQERARLKAEHIVRRARRREMWGGSASDSDELPPSLTRSELEFDMIQAEADWYMNSPKAGSE